MGFVFFIGPVIYIGLLFYAVLIVDKKLEGE
jgi:hypothetical protein